MEEQKTNYPSNPEEEITRKEALKKAGKYAAFTAAAMISVLVPKESQALSFPKNPPVW